MRNYIFSVLFFWLVCSFVPTHVYAQCASIYNKGLACMKSGRYKEAIKNFGAAKVCDGNLTAKCDKKINECRWLMSQAAKKKEEKKVVIPSVLKINKTSLDFYAEDGQPQKVKIESYPLEWKASSSEGWCKVEKVDSMVVAISCEMNNTTVERSAKVLLSNSDKQAEIEVKQTGKAEVFVVNVEKLEFDKKGGIQEVEIETNTEWEVADKPEWVEISGQMKDKLFLQVGETRQANEGTLTLKTKSGKIFTSIIVTQKGKFGASLFRKKGKK